MPTTMTSKGQAAIPKRVRDTFGLEPGDKIEFDMNPDGWIVIRATNDDKPPSNPCLAVGRHRFTGAEHG